MIHRERMADKHGVGTIGGQFAIGLISDLDIRQHLPAIERQVIGEHDALRGSGSGHGASDLGEAVARVNRALATKAFRPVFTR